MGNELDIAQLSRDKKMKEMAVQCEAVAEAMFSKMAEFNWSLAQGKHFFEMMLPTLFKQRIDQALITIMVEDVLDKTAKKVKDNL